MVDSLSMGSSLLLPHPVNASDKMSRIETIHKMFFFIISTPYDFFYFCLLPTGTISLG